MRKLRAFNREGAHRELDIEEVLRQFEQRLKDQKERHDGGNRWIGTGGSSPFGRGGENPMGIQVGPPGGGKGGAMKTADARKYRPYRHDLVLDVRQVEVALRKLRAFNREGAHRELDIEATIDETARNAGELEIVTRPPRRPNTRVLLMMDVGGSMDPYAHLVSQLFSAAKRSTHWKELRTYYFHNCVYGKVYKTEGFQDPVSVKDLIHECGKHYKLVFVGDASMAPYELLGSANWGGDDAHVAGVSWLAALRDHFDRSVWLNPEWTAPFEGETPGAQYGYQSTVDVIRGIYPMFPLTLAGLDEAIKELMGKKTARPMVLPRSINIL
ncbi:MAG: VWA domain-containing protein [Polyangiaceae bacterium]